MKKVFMLFAIMFMSLTTFAQTNQGESFVGLRLTDVGFRNEDGVTAVGVGAQVGHFIMEDLAVVADVGYSSLHAKDYNANDWNYGVGMKWYVGKKVPFQVDYNGSIGNFSKPLRSNVGFQLGYAIFVDRFSFEPSLRYNVDLTKNYSNTFSGGVGVNYFF